MAKYWEDWSGSTLGARVPTGWTRRLNSTRETFTVEEETHELAPAGRRLRMSNEGGTQRSYLSLDAVDSDSDKLNFTISALCITNGISGPAASRGGVAGRIGGSGGGGENAYQNVANTSESGSGTSCSALTQYVNGSFTALSRLSDGALVEGVPYWLELQVEDLGSGNMNVTHRQRNGATPSTIIYQNTVESSSLPTDGWLGLFHFSQASSCDVLAVAIATGTDEIFFEEPSASTPVAFTGTVTAQSWVENAAITPLDLSTYFSGSLTPFSYAVTTGTLPTGLSLNTSTGVISGTPTTPAAAVSIVVTATDTGTNTAATNAFDITITAAVVVVKGVRVTTSAVSVTGLTAMWWDSNPPTGNPVFSTATASTDGAGLLELNLDATTALDVAQHGTLVLYKLDGTDHQDSLGAVSRLTIEDIA